MSQQTATANIQFNSHIVSSLLNNALSLRAAIAAGSEQLGRRADTGLCANLVSSDQGDYMVQTSYKILSAIVSFWPEHSGCQSYPIKSYLPESEHTSLSLIGAGKDIFAATASAGKQYEIAKYSGYMYSSEHPYGAARLRLLDYVIERLVAMLASIPEITQIDSTK